MATDNNETSHKQPAKTIEDLKQEILVELLLCLNYGWKQHTMGTKGTCEVCLDDLSNKYVLETPCGHFFDLDCIVATIATYSYYKCPKCSNPYKKKT